MEPRIPKESAPFDTDGRWTRTWIMYFESLFDLSVEEAVKEAGTVTHTGGELTLDMPVFGNGEDDVKVGTKSGNTNEVATVAGAVVTGNTVQWDADGNLIDAGVTPGGGGGGGGVSSVTGTAPIASSGGATPDISIATFTGDSGSGGARGAVPAPAAGDAVAGKVLGAGGGWVAGGSGGTPAYISSLIAGPDTTKTITGATHAYATAALLVQVYDNASPRNAIEAGWTVNSSTFDVVITFASPQSNYYVVINGATGPAGPTGPPGSGTVTSVALTVPAEFSVAGSPVTTSGTLAVSKATQSANTVYAGPTTGSAAAPTFRAVVPADLPLASSSAFGACKVDGTTITASSGVISAAGGVAGALVLLEQHTASGSASLNFTAWYSSAYDVYEIHIVGILPASNSILRMRVSSNGGSTWASANYGWSNFGADSGGAYAGSTAMPHSTSDSSFQLTNTLFNGSVAGADGWIKIYHPGNSTQYMNYVGQIAESDTDLRRFYMLNGQYATGDAINGLQFLMSTGNIASGTIRVYGIAK